MKKAYHTIDDVLRSPWAERKPFAEKAVVTDRVLRSTRLEDSIYTDLRNGDSDLDALEQTAAKKMSSFPALSRDVYQSFYSLLSRRTDEKNLSVAARKLNGPILDHITESEDYPALKAICEGRELPAYEAATEFISRTAADLDSLLSALGGNKGAVGTLGRLEKAEAQAESELAAMLKQLQRSKARNEALEQSIVAAANTAESKRRQVEAVGKLVDAGAAKSKDAVTALVAQAMVSATEKAREVQNILGAWSNAPEDMKRTESNMQLLSLVQKSETLKMVSKYLGRFREIFAQGKKNAYTYGRGEKYTLELGRDLTRAISSELAMLSARETLPLFLRKYQRGQIKQYRRREPVYKGAGDIICCLDESTSTKGDPAAWGKAVALTLLEIAANGGRSFALIHFSGPGSVQTDLFRPGAYTVADKMAAAETFLSGGTNFQTPMDEALRLMQEEGFENADIIFITDGECKLSKDYLEHLHAEQLSRRFTITGVLLDKGEDSLEFSLNEFCQNIYRTSELLGDEIVRELVSKRA